MRRYFVCATLVMLAANCTDSAGGDAAPAEAGAAAGPGGTPAPVASPGSGGPSSAGRNGAAGSGGSAGPRAGGAGSRALPDAGRDAGVPDAAALDAASPVDAGGQAPDADLDG